jgi:hypothetical protein
LAGSKSRCGRYMNCNSTDGNLRALLDEDARQGRLTIWAKKFAPSMRKEIVCGKETDVKAYPHKYLELLYIDIIERTNGVKPRGNSCRK